MFRFSTAAMVARTCRNANVTLCVHCLSRLFNHTNSSSEQYNLQNVNLCGLSGNF